MSFHKEETIDALVDRADVANDSLAKAVDTLLWAYETLQEINVNNYNHDDVCKLNDASVEVILGIRAVLAEMGELNE